MNASAARPGRPVDEIILSDGERVQGMSLGRNQTLDAGLIKLEDRRGGEPAPLEEMSDRIRQHLFGLERLVERLTADATLPDRSAMLSRAAAGRAFGTLTTPA